VCNTASSCADNWVPIALICSLFSPFAPHLIFPLFPHFFVKTQIFGTAAKGGLLEHLQRWYSVCHPASHIFFTSKFSYLLFCNPTHQTQTWTTNNYE
jgi:hypothetical protein